jgi:hypothetical protein
LIGWLALFLLFCFGAEGRALGQRTPVPQPPRRWEMMMDQITGDMKVAEVLRRYPAAADVFLGRGCPDMRRGLFNLMSRLMSVRNAARVHRIELGPLLEDLNRAAHSDAGRKQ